MTATTAHIQTTKTVYAILFAAAGCHLINDTMQAIMLASYPLLRESYALTFTQVGLMTFAFQITGSVFQPFIGSYTDKHPFPAILPLAPAFTFVGFILLALAPSYALLLTAAICIGIGSAMFHPDASRVSRLSSGGKFGFAQSTFQVGGNVGTSFGPLLAAWFIIPNGQQSILWFALLAVASMSILAVVARWFANHLTATAAKPVLTKPSTVSSRTITISMSILGGAHVFKICLHVEHAFILRILLDGQIQPVGPARPD